MDNDIDFKGDTNPLGVFRYWEKDDLGLLNKVGDRFNVLLKVLVSGDACDAVIPTASVFTGNLGGVIIKSAIIFLVGVVNYTVATILCLVFQCNFILKNYMLIVFHIEFYKVSAILFSRALISK